MDVDQRILLLIEARQPDINILLRMLREADKHRLFMIEVVQTLADGIRYAQEADAAIIDLSLPDASGIESFKRLRDSTDIPIVVITNKDDEALGLNAIKEGAQDYLVIGQFTATALYRSIMYAIERHRRLAAEKRLDSVLTALTEMRKEVNGLTNEVRNCRTAVNNLSYISDSITST